MYVVGLNGSARSRTDAAYTDLDSGAHNSAAALLKDGEVIAAIEEERLDRLKHSHKTPMAALQFCLESAKIGIEDVDYFAYYLAEDKVDELIKQDLLAAASQGRPRPRARTARGLLIEAIRSHFGVAVPPERVEFVRHHVCHALSAFSMSGFDSSLVATFDGVGEDESGIIVHAKARRELTIIESFSPYQSLGIFYLRVIAFLGYYHFDEYKVMGLAPYGDAARFREMFSNLYVLKRAGDFEISMAIERALSTILEPRQKDEPLEQIHKDVAAALQESLETIALHVLRHYRERTKQSRLCLAGGVALNCSMNGKILEAGLFEDIFVQPAAFDAGCCLGAALATYEKHAEDVSGGRRLRQVYWGTDIGGDEDVFRALAPWSGLVAVERCESIATRAAELLAQGNVIGWVQGRSEFGPRALGNRSILADPRPAENRDRVNAMIKKREGYRPFAPAVAIEALHEYFELPPGVSELPFMLFVCKVKGNYREQLGAITHVDGSSRVQSVARDVNESFWTLLHAFEGHSGIPMVLNTSFNNNWEPIVDSVQDAIVCFLTTGLDYTVIGNYLVSRRGHLADAFGSLVPRLPWYVELRESMSTSASGDAERTTSIVNVHASRFIAKTRHDISSWAWQVLRRADGESTLDSCFECISFSNAEHRRQVRNELIALWERRLISLSPAASAVRSLDEASTGCQ